MSTLKKIGRPGSPCSYGPAVDSFFVLSPQPSSHIPGRRGKMWCSTEFVSSTSRGLKVSPVSPAREVPHQVSNIHFLSHTFTFVLLLSLPLSHFHFRCDTTFWYFPFRFLHCHIRFVFYFGFLLRLWFPYLHIHFRFCDYWNLPDMMFTPIRTKILFLQNNEIRFCEFDETV